MSCSESVWVGLNRLSAVYNRSRLEPVRSRPRVMTGVMRPVTSGSGSVFHLAREAVTDYSSVFGPEGQKPDLVELWITTWTSSNQFAFLAIVAHYVTNDGQLGLFFALKMTKSDYLLCLLLQKSFSSIFENSSDSIRERTWLKQFGQQWSYMASSGRQGLFRWSMLHSLNDSVTGDCHCNR